MLKHSLCVALLTAAAVGVASSAAEIQLPMGADRPVVAPLAALKPSWKVGQSWIVETATRSLQKRTLSPQHEDSLVVRWQFKVEAVDVLAGRDCFRVSVTCLDEKTKAPEISLWADQKSMALIRVQAHLPTADGKYVLTENYASGADQAAPVIGPFPALPLDLPLLLGPAKGAGTFSYESRSGSGLTKAAGEIGFAFSLSQEIQPLSVAERDKLTDLPATFDPAAAHSTVRMTDTIRKVFQVWQPGHPWPVYADNGMTVSRLLEVSKN